MVPRAHAYILELPMRLYKRTSHMGVRSVSALKFETRDSSMHHPSRLCITQTREARPVNFLLLATYSRIVSGYIRVPG